MVKRDLLRNILIVVALILVAMGLRTWVLEPVTITDQMANQYLATDDQIIAIMNSTVDYGDFLLYEEDGVEYVSRVIAMPGDTVTYMDDVLYRNDEIIAENYLSHTTDSEYYTEDLTIATITNGETDTVSEETYFVLNDNRANHKDSREFGLITNDQVIGRLSFRISPFSKFGFIEVGLNE